MMSLPVNQRIVQNPPTVMGRRDPDSAIKVRSLDRIRASGLVPRQQAGHTTANDLKRRIAIKSLPTGALHTWRDGRQWSRPAEQDVTAPWTKPGVKDHRRYVTAPATGRTDLNFRAFIGLDMCVA